MTKFSDLWKHRVHEWVKPTMRWMAGVAHGTVHDIIKEREKKGWSSELIRKMRKAYTRFEQMEIETGSFKDKNYREWLRQIFDMICLQLDVESPLTEKRWKQLVDIAKEEGLI